MSLRLITAGESHGPGLTCIVEGLPAGLELDPDAINADMARRQLGHGRGGRMKIEKDAAEVTSGVRHGRTLGGPIALSVANRDYANWEERMNPWPVEAAVPEVHLPRPGHADLAGVQKYGFTDVRNVLERASARETAARVAGGALAKGFLRALGVEVVSHVIQIGTVQAPERDELAFADFADVDASPVRCLDAEASRAMVEEINVLRKRNESLGGVFEVRAFGLVPGLGSHVSWEERLDGRIGPAMLSIQAIKGCGIGDGFDLAGRPGSAAHDEIFYADERGCYRETNRSGGLEGGMTTGEPLVVRAAMKPLPTLTKPLRSVDIATHEPAQALRERTDSSVVPAAGVVGEAMLAIVLARPTARSSAATTSTTSARRSRPTRSGSGGSGAGPDAGRLVFIGFMGAGKSSAARTVAAEFGADAVDSDHLLEERLGSSIEDYFGSHGERGFREQEEELVRELLEAPPGPVLSLGGGAVTSERVHAALARHTVVLLDVDAETAWARRRPAPARARPRPLRGAARRAHAALRRARRRDPARRPPRRGAARAARPSRRWARRRRARSCCGRGTTPSSSARGCSARGFGGR